MAPNDTNTISNDSCMSSTPFVPPSTDNDTNPPDDKLDLLDDISFHHNSPFDNSQADLEIKEPEDSTKKPEPADKSEPETSKEPQSVEPEKPELKKPKASRQNKTGRSRPIGKGKASYTYVYWYVGSAIVIVATAW